MTHWTWRFVGLALAAVGIYLGRPDFEIVLLSLMCFLAADIMGIIERD